MRKHNLFRGFWVVDDGMKAGVEALGNDQINQTTHDVVAWPAIDTKSPNSCLLRTLLHNDSITRPQTSLQLSLS